MRWNNLSLKKLGFNYQPNIFNWPQYENLEGSTLESATMDLHNGDINLFSPNVLTISGDTVNISALVLNLNIQTLFINGEEIDISDFRRLRRL